MVVKHPKETTPESRQLVGAETGGLDVVRGGVPFIGGDATSAGELLGEAAGDAPRAFRVFHRGNEYFTEENLERSEN